jgi:predicted glycoside hydrolase/deacetylase ChbG (UPF0249 family)
MTNDAFPSSSKKLLIVNADDFGFSAHTVEATIECFSKGVISSATVMPNMPAFEQAVQFAVTHPEFSYGLHLCLSDEWPVSSPYDIPSLVSPSGKLWLTRDLWKRAATGRLSCRDIAVEIEAQIRRLKSVGIRPSHLDGHSHVHKIPQVIAVLPHVLREEGVKAVRRTQNLFYKIKSSPLSRVYNRVSNVFLARFSKTTDFFLMVAHTIGNGDDGWWGECLGRLPTGVTEIGIHPGWDEEWRKLETLPVLHDATRSLRAAGIDLITYNHFIERKSC